MADSFELFDKDSILGLVLSQLAHILRHQPSQFFVFLPFPLEELAISLVQLRWISLNSSYG